MKSQYVEYLIERLENAELDNRVIRPGVGGSEQRVTPLQSDVRKIK